MTVVRSLLGFRLLYLTGSVAGRLGFRVVHWKYILVVSTTVDPKDLQSITSAVVLSCTVLILDVSRRKVGDASMCVCHVCGSKKAESTLLSWL